MNNYIKCNQMIFGSRSKYCIAFKTNQPCFEVFSRKYNHNFRAQVSHENLEGSMSIELLTMNAFIITKVDRMIMYDVDTFQACGEIPIKLLPANSREPNEIIGIQKSDDEMWLAVISGKNLIMNEQSQNQLFIFNREKHKVFDSDSENSVDEYEDTFRQYKRIMLRDLPLF